jgi:hypothetical protein
MFGFQRFDKEVAAKLERLDTLSTHCGVGRGMPCCTKATPCIPKHAGSWSAEFRRLCGYRTEAEFPNVVQSWSDRLHPDEYPPV